MTQARRGKIITGNWKMYKTLEEARSFIKKLIPSIQNCTSQIFLAVPFTMIKSLAKEAEGSRLKIGAQNMNDASEGAFTGEIAGKMLKEAGADFVLIGHSERRRLFHEDNDFINRKIMRALEDGLKPVLCIGETKEEYEEGHTQEVVRRQLTEGLKGIDLNQLNSLIVAYEPVWAIGTGYSATPEIAEQAQAYCRHVLSEILNPELADQIIIQYGGSANPSNAKDLLNQPDIDGLLIGGASLSLESFVKIIDDSESVLNLKVESL